MRLLPSSLWIALAAAACAAGPALDAPVSHEVPPGAEIPGEPSPTFVEPRPGRAGVRPQAFDTATPVGDGTRLEVRFWGGVAPCFVLDHVKVDETPEAVTVTLFAGSDPTQPDVVCIEIALLMAVRVPLAAPLAGRPVHDGAAAPPGG